MKITHILTAALVVAAIAGGTSWAAIATQPKKLPATQFVVIGSEGESAATVQKVVITGTACIIAERDLPSGYAGEGIAISCDWSVQR